MANKNLYVDFHVLQTVPPSCVNRDDTGRPKTAVYGGVQRARVSSQSWKRAMRSMFTEENKGYRSKGIVALIEEKIKEKAADKTDAEVKKLANEAASKAKLKKPSDKEMKTLFFISEGQIARLADVALSEEKKDEDYVNAVKEEPSIDIAMFGRMVADDPSLNYDAAVQVSHSISTHAVEVEEDYFTAVDDCSPEDTAGAGHLGTTEYNSATLYRYATVNMKELVKSLKDIDQSKYAVKEFANAFIYSMPTGKQNSFANRTLPDCIYVTVRTDQPINFATAFEKPVRYSDTGGYSEKSKEAFANEAKRIYSLYVDEPIYSWSVGINIGYGAEEVKVSSMVEKLGEVLEKEMAESENV